MLCACTSFVIMDGEARSLNRRLRSRSWSTRQVGGCLPEDYGGAQGRSGCLEDRVEVPFEKLMVWSVGLPVRQRDYLPRLSVELLAVAELVTQSWADQQ